ncbi:glycosyltransferase [Mesorhizobium sp. CAU 1732]|uniref:glycosyltransferase n=1 Tax=Mesorhizobium sp. CAU 1732 TaxID=3140358 RepID=UPI00325FE1DA
MQRIVRRAVANDTSLLRELLAAGVADEAGIFRAIAAHVGLEFLETIDPDRIVMRERDRLLALKRGGGARIVKIDQGDGTFVFAQGNRDLDLVNLRRLTAGRNARERMKIVAPQTLRRALISLSEDSLLRGAQNALFVDRTDFSARLVMNGWQGVFVGTVGLGVPVALALAFQSTLIALNVVAVTAFLACVLIRVMALGSASPIRKRDLPQVDPAVLPTYSVLVALYRESAVVPELLVALGKLQWPRSKLEIKLVCEEDDHETLAALRAHALRPYVEIIEVPAGSPRTKPKALAYALPLCTGEFVTLFDAEDRPHPQQLLEAWQRFDAEDEDLACLQAPLVVTNGGSSEMSRMFAFEYAGLFRALLPWLASWNLMMPLGGTSNHFRRDALVKAGGWDPYNVTEDADLGLRLKRLGYRCGVLDLPTLEDAPETLKVWLPQRVRWFKGWAQTWLVHMRDPVALYRDLGFASFVVTQILVFGMLVSALLHPVFFLTIAYIAVKMMFVGAVGTLEVIMLALGSLNILCGYAAFIAIGALTLSLREKPWLATIIVRTPLHWLLLSLAAWMALWEMKQRPHHWNKTPHKPTRQFRRQAKAVVNASRAPSLHLR